MPVIDIFNSSDMRAFDKRAIDDGCTEIELIARAGKKLAFVNSYMGKTAIICGSGNNGADGIALAVALVEKGIDIKNIDLYCFKKDDKFNLSKGAEYFADLFLQAGGELKTYNGGGFKNYDTIVDCIFGTGLSREVEGIQAIAIDDINNSGAFVISADVPSGLNSDNGLIMGKAVKANLTVCFVGYKQGCYLNDAKDCVGTLTLADIDIKTQPSNVKLLVDFQLAERKENTHKKSFGKLLIVGGSKSYSGAPMLSYLATAALRSGVGLCELCIPQCIYDAVAAHNLLATFCVMPHDGNAMVYDAKFDEAIDSADAIAFGMGFSRTDQGGKFLEKILNSEKKVLIDADGIYCLSQNLHLLKGCKANVVVTPHPKEFSLLCGLSVQEILSRPIKTAKEFSEKYGVITLLKGVGATISNGSLTVLTDKGTSGMAKGGSGDVLSGVIGAFMAEGLDNFEAAYGGAFITGSAGQLAAKEIGAASMLPTDTISFLPKVLNPPKIETTVAVKKF